MHAFSSTDVLVFASEGGCYIRVRAPLYTNPLRSLVDIPNSKFHFIQECRNGMSRRPLHEKIPNGGRILAFLTAKKTVPHRFNIIPRGLCNSKGLDGLHLLYVAPELPHHQFPESQRQRRIKSIL